jgi:hypothetical protein
MKKHRFFYRTTPAFEKQIKILTILLNQVDVLVRVFNYNKSGKIKDYRILIIFDNYNIDLFNNDFFK